MNNGYIEDFLAAFNQSIAEWYDLVREMADYGISIPITDQINARQPRDQIFLKKERRKTQYIPKQNRHAVNMARRR